MTWLESLRSNPKFQWTAVWSGPECLREVFNGREMHQQVKEFCVWFFQNKMLSLTLKRKHSYHHIQVKDLFLMLFPKEFSCWGGAECSITQSIWFPLLLAGLIQFQLVCTSWVFLKMYYHYCYNVHFFPTSSRRVALNVWGDPLFWNHPCVFLFI